MTSTQSLRERKTIPTASPGSQQKQRSKSEKLRFFFPGKEHLWPLEEWNTLSSSSAPKGMPCGRSEVPRNISSSVILSHLLQQALCLWKGQGGGGWNQRSRGWLTKEKQKLNNVRFIWTQAIFCVAYSNCFHFFELVSAKVKTIRLPSKS